MRVVVDYDVCEANGICERRAPQVFHLDDEDNLHLLQEEPPPELHDATRAAVDGCPKLALSITEDEGR